MEFSKTQKTIAVCCAIISAIAAGLHSLCIPITILFMLATGFCLYKKLLTTKFFILLIVLFCITIFYTKIKIPKPDELIYYNNKTVQIEGLVDSLPDTNTQGRLKFQFKVDKLIYNNVNKNIRAKTIVYLAPDNKIKIRRNDRLKLTVSIMEPFPVTNEGEFDYGKYLKNSSIFTLSFAKEVKPINYNKSPPQIILQLIDQTREQIIEEHKKHLNTDNLEILGGIVFGSEAIKPSPILKKMFINSGLYHLLAASGMNVAFIFSIWFFLFRFLRINYKFIIISGGLVVVLYALMTGLPPSVTRATWMLELALLAKLINRNSDNNTILFLVCAILLIYNPMLINDIGFLLSFMVTFGLINTATPLINLIKFIPPKISGWFIIPFIAQLWAAPIQAYYFQTFSLYSIIANMLVVPFMAFISFTGFISSIFAIIPHCEIICLILDKLNAPFLSFTLLIADTFSKIPNNIIHMAKLSLMQITLYYLLLICIIYMTKLEFRNIKLNIVSIMLTLVLVLSFSVQGSASDLNFTFLNVGEGDSIFIRTPNKKNILVDTGRYYGNRHNSGSSVIIPFLRVNGISSLDLLVLTHPDSDHIGGSVDVLQNIRVKKLITNGETAKNKSFFKLQKFIKENNQNLQVIKNKEEISPDKDVSIIAIKPKNIDDKNQNDTSLILVIKYKDFDAILMGDNEAYSQEYLREYSNRKIEIFKVGHHGSKRSIDKEMAEFIAPQVSVISVGENSYGHPHKQVLNLLKDSTIYRTDTDNAIKIKTNGLKYESYKYTPIKSKWQKDLTKKPCSA